MEVELYFQTNNNAISVVYNNNNNKQSFVEGAH